MNFPALGKSKIFFFLMHHPTLFTERLILRPFNKSDADRVQVLAGHKKVAATTLNIPHPYPDGLAGEWIATHEEDFILNKSVTFAVCLKEDQTLIGAIGLSLKIVHDRAELGYWVGVPYWNQGYCTEAARAVMNFGFVHLKLNRIFAHHLQGNEASGKVMRKTGMKKESVLRSHVKHWGKYHDIVLYGILKEEFPE